MQLTIRIISRGSPAIIYEIDGRQVDVFHPSDDGEPQTIMKAIEKALVIAGWKPDLGRMYIDDSLLVLNFESPQEKVL